MLQVNQPLTTAAALKVERECEKAQAVRAYEPGVSAHSDRDRQTSHIDLRLGPNRRLSPPEALRWARILAATPSQITHAA